ncbi:hypothetical protein ACTHRZ_12420, partial [Neisseria sp. P0001.S006]|uniref:hypothetical protein n=1 Tax=Neisseria sp. P0001.S006 TaxID=3436650 RepID=UPI003F8123B7
DGSAAVRMLMLRTKLRQPSSSYYRSAGIFGRCCADCVLRTAGRQVQYKLNYGIAFAGFEQTQ